MCCGGSKLLGPGNNINMSKESSYISYNMSKESYYMSKESYHCIPAGILTVLRLTPPPPPPPFHLPPSRALALARLPLEYMACALLEEDGERSGEDVVDVKSSVCRLFLV